MNRKKRKSESLSAQKPRNGCPRKSASLKVTSGHFANTAMEDEEYISKKACMRLMGHEVGQADRHYFRPASGKTVEAKDAPPED